MNQLSYYVTKRLIVGSKDSSGTIIHSGKLNNQFQFTHFTQSSEINELNFFNSIGFMKLMKLRVN